MDIIDIAIAKSYTEASLIGAGALKGQDGADGKSAYEIACDNGFDGTEQEWLDSLKGNENSGEDNKIESISVNGNIIVPDENKNISITIPDQYDDTELKNQMIALERMADVISDSEVRIDKTYSSSKIYNELQQVLVDSKEYTLSEIGKASGASYKVATSTDEMIDTKYIYLLQNGDTYDLYIFEGDTATATKIGNTTIDLSDFYTKSEINSAFVLQTAFDLLNGSIGNASTLSTEAKVVVDAINEIVDGTTTVGNANALNGYDSNYFMPASVILWENPDITTEFTRQSINLDAEFANCKYYEIICIRRSSSSTGRLVSFSSGKIPQTQAVLLNLFTQYYYTRLSNVPNVSNCSITFEDCKAASTYGATTNDITDNTFCVPMTILGYKE